MTACMLYAITLGTVGWGLVDKPAMREPVGSSFGEGAQDAVPCEPSTPTRLTDRLVAEAEGWMSGSYTLTVVSTRGHAGDSVTVGTLRLVRTDETHREAGPPTRTRPLYGWTDADLSVFARVSLRYPATSRDPNRPGVEVVVDRTDQNIVMILGAASTVDTLYFDAGVIFFVYAVDSLGFSGLWQDGGRTGLPAGYFCAVRLAGGG